MRRLAIALALLGCDAAPDGGRCDDATWVAPAEPLAIPVRASGAVSWASGDAPITIAGTLAGVEGDTVLRFDTEEGELAVEIELPRARLGVLPLGRVVDITLDHGVVLVEEGRLAMAAISRRGAGDVIAASVTFRQAYAECVSTSCATASCEGACVRVMASPLVDVVTGASTVRLEPGGLWRIPDDDDPSAEIEIVRSVRAPAADELEPVSGEPCIDAPAHELAAIVRRLR